MKNLQRYYLFEDYVNIRDLTIKKGIANGRGCGSGFGYPDGSGNGGGNWLTSGGNNVLGGSGFGYGSLGTHYFGEEKNMV